MRMWLAKLGGKTKFRPFGWKSITVAVVAAILVGLGTIDVISPQKTGAELNRSALWMDRTAYNIYWPVRNIPGARFLLATPTWIASHLKRLASVRQSLAAQEFVARELLGRSIHKRDPAWAQVWLYGLYRQGGLAYAYLLPQGFWYRLLPDQTEDEVNRALRQASNPPSQFKEPDVDPSQRRIIAENNVIEARLNWGATLIGAAIWYSPYAIRDINLNEDQMKTAEGREMLRRGITWFSARRRPPATPTADCNDYAAVIEDVLAGQLGKIRTCHDKNRADPMPYGEWRRFLSCARDTFVPSQPRWDSTREQGLDVVKKCSTPQSADG